MQLRQADLIWEFPVAAVIMSNPEAIHILSSVCIQPFVYVWEEERMWQMGGRERWRCGELIDISVHGKNNFDTA